jgi:hypothetical protein
MRGHKITFETVAQINLGAEDDFHVRVSGTWYDADPGDRWGRRGAVVAPEDAEFVLDTIEIMAPGGAWLPYPLALISADQRQALAEDAGREVADGALGRAA